MADLKAASARWCDYNLVRDGRSVLVVNSDDALGNCQSTRDNKRYSELWSRLVVREEVGPMEEKTEWFRKV